MDDLRAAVAEGFAIPTVSDAVVIAIAAASFEILVGYVWGRSFMAPISS